MKTSESKKRIILIWDFDGAIGQINASYPYNYNFLQLERELLNVRCILNILESYKIKCCFAVTGFSAEQGVYPYVFPDLINEISKAGHEIASHSWRHEWVPLFTKDQVYKSLKRSKSALESAIENRQIVTGFIPPHNRPMSWLKRGAFSLGDKGLYPFFKMGDTGKLISLLRTSGYNWLRISYKSFFRKGNISKSNITGRVYRYNDILILENHYTGFDKYVIDHILNTSHSTYTISAHPLMFDYSNKKENGDNFKNFLNVLTDPAHEIEFIVPASLCNS